MKITDKGRHLEESEVFCMLPWVHMNIEPSGRAFSCCVSKTLLGSTKESSLPEIWNSPKMRALRQDMIAGRKNSACRACYASERVNIPSLRQWANNEFPHHWDAVLKTRSDGLAREFRLPYLDIRFSNLCNFRCRICGPHASSGWYDDIKKMQLPSHLWAGAPALPMKTAAKDAKELHGWLEELLPHVEAIRFQGGEPLIMSEHYEVLDFLIKRRMFGVRLIYNTNFSITKFKGRDVMRLWDLFENVDVSASLDGMGRRGEYLRKGQHWAQAVSNRKRMISACSRVCFRIAPTLCAMNALHLPDFHREWVEQGYIDAESIHINILAKPEIYSCQILPAHLKSLAKQRYQEHIECFLRPLGAQRAEKYFSGAIKHMYGKDISHKIPEFCQITAKLDEIRKENFRSVFPELSDLFEDAVPDLTRNKAYGKISA